MATQEEIDAGAEALAQWNAPNISLKERGPERQAVLRKEAALVLEAAERVREGLSKSRARRLGHFVMTGDDVLIREDRPE